MKFSPVTGCAPGFAAAKVKLAPDGNGAAGRKDVMLGKCAVAQAAREERITAGTLTICLTAAKPVGIAVVWDRRRNAPRYGGRGVDETYE